MTLGNAHRLTVWRRPVCDLAYAVEFNHSSELIAARTNEDVLFEDLSPEEALALADMLVQAGRLGLAMRAEREAVKP